MKNLASLEQLIDSFEKFPSIGHRTAERLAYAVLEMDENTVQEISKNIINAKSKIHPCKICGMYTEDEICDICKDIENRDPSKLIVVSTTKDAFAIEKINTSYKYHVLNGDISLLKNITPDKLNIASLLERIKNENIKEVIIATNPTVEGETTAQYIAKILEKENVTVSRLA